ncbi:hypothetical protein K437DRAFT_256838 [Tilletiaria anomala UBC 951]|uniref:SDE2-like domain-containing protein n=1 Tax=Tilletiaria anomala (strain ATCC 24038 / CBS 436.72 / UBC 951) TaxID=1037660 RepID=A0A066VT58_TILAU|nr:uncharacterized protein K437DRAFT_256838 [Tilletiaria anomala UBC 951]KDN44882.1 hypothetical protein K437DRAFT_256838 [Tilletiaria anomala UBC 951]
MSVTVAQPARPQALRCATPLHDPRLAGMVQRLRVAVSSLAVNNGPENSIPFLLQLPSPFTGSVSLAIAASATLSDLLLVLSHILCCDARSFRLVHHASSSTLPCLSLPFSALVQPPSCRSHATQSPLTLVLLPRLPGGKGGFGSMLRAAGGKMSSAARKRGEENTDSCRDLNGRRLSVLKEARKLAAYLEQEPERRKAMDERMQAKYRRLEKMLGRTPKGQADLEEAARKMGEDEAALEDADEFDSNDEAPASENEAGPSTSACRAVPSSRSSRPAAVERAERFEDHEYLEQSKEIITNARSAVAAAMKKKKKAAANKSKPSSTDASAPAHL